MKKNIAIIVQKLSGGGAERAAANLSIFLNDYYNVHLIVFDGKNIKYPYAGTIHDLNSPAEDGKLIKVKLAVERAAAIKKIKKQEHIDATISLMDSANILNVYTSCGDRVITSIRNHMTRKYGDKVFFRKISMKYIGKGSDYVVSPALATSEDIVANFGIPAQKAVTINNACDGELLKSKAVLHEAEAAKMPEKSIVTMGRMNRQKGYWHLLRAFAETLKTVPGAKLYFLGEGELLDKHKKLAEDLGIADSVVFLGNVEAPHAYIMHSSAFVLPSLYEGMSNAILEALACGAACIATDCYSGSREILSGTDPIKEFLDEIEYAEYGILVSVDGKGGFNAEEPLSKAEKQLCEAMTRLLTDDELREHYSRQAEKRIADFSPEAIVEKWKQIL